MSVIRFGEEGSDVYVYASVKGYWECCGCRLVKEQSQSQFYTADGMILHLQYHLSCGDVVPESAIRRLEKRRSEELKVWVDHECNNKYIVNE